MSSDLPKLLVVTGTDTGVGKTAVALGLISALRARGLSVAALKPIETGCTRDSRGELIGEDFRALAAAAHHAACPFRYELPAAPSVASRGQAPIVPGLIRAALDDLAAHQPDVILIESAGGLLVPITDTLLFVDLAREFGARAALVVARNALGTINHSLLTMRELRRAELTPLALVLNDGSTSTRSPDQETNASEIARHSGVPVARLARLSDPTPASLAAALTASLDLDALLTALPRVSSPADRA